MGGRHFSDMYLFLTESGANALNVLFFGDVVDDDDRDVILIEHAVALSELRVDGTPPQAAHERAAEPKSKPWKPKTDNNSSPCFWRDTIRSFFRTPFPTQFATIWRSSNTAVSSPCPKTGRFRTFLFPLLLMGRRFDSSFTTPTSFPLSLSTIPSRCRFRRGVKHRRTCRTRSTRCPNWACVMCTTVPITTTTRGSSPLVWVWRPAGTPPCRWRTSTTVSVVPRF